MATRIEKVDTLSPRTAYRKGPLLLGLPFVGMGAFFALAGFELVDVDLDANAPLWVIGCLGLAFLIAGALFSFHGARGVLNQARIAEARRMRGRDRPWDYDYPWNPDGIRDRAFARVGQALVGLALLAVFLAPFNWWAFLSREGSWMVRIITGVFDLILLFVLGKALYLMGRFVKYGHSRLRFVRFPFHPGERLEVVFSPNRFDALQATLRFVEERFETTGTGRNRTTQQVNYALFSKTKQIEPGRVHAEVEIGFDLPDDAAWSTSISAQPVRYWELLLEAEVDGIDFRTTFPLPVYARQSSATATPTAAPTT